MLTVVFLSDRQFKEEITMDAFTFMIAGVILIVVVALLAMAIKIANQWERAVVLFLGRFIGIKGPGIFLIVPILSGSRTGSISGSSPRRSMPSRP